MAEFMRAAGSPRRVTENRCIVNGVECWGLAKPDGVTIGPNTVDAKTSGRAELNAEMHRKLVAVKDKIVIKFRNLSQEECQRVIQAVYQEFVAVSYVSPRYGVRNNVEFYAQVNTPTLTVPMWLKGKWEPWTWAGLELTLTEK